MQTMTADQAPPKVDILQAQADKINAEDEGFGDFGNFEKTVTTKEIKPEMAMTMAKQQIDKDPFAELDPPKADQDGENNDSFGNFGEAVVEEENDDPVIEDVSDV